MRLRDQEQGCISCGTPLVGKYDAGHFFSAGGHGSVRFDEDNIYLRAGDPARYLLLNNGATGAQDAGVNEDNFSIVVKAIA